MSINNVTLMGRLTAAPELKSTQSGVSVTSFCIAVDRKYKAKGEEKNPDTFYGVSKDVWQAIAVGVTFHENQKEKE